MIDCMIIEEKFYDFFKNSRDFKNTKILTQNLNIGFLDFKKIFKNCPI